MPVIRRGRGKIKRRILPKRLPPIVPAADAIELVRGWIAAKRCRDNATAATLFAELVRLAQRPFRRVPDDTSEADAPEGPGA